MNLSNLVEPINQVQAFVSQYNIPNYVIFLIFTFLAILVGRYTPSIVRIFISRFFPKQGKDVYEELIPPVHKPLKIAGS